MYSISSDGIRIWRDWLEGRYDVLQHITAAIDSASIHYNNTADYVSIPWQSEYSNEWYGRFVDLETFVEQIRAADAAGEVGDCCVYNDTADDCNPDMRLLEEYINELAGT